MLAAIAAVALIAPGLVGFDDWSLAPSPPVAGSVRVEPAGIPGADGRAGASATALPVTSPKGSVARSHGAGRSPSVPDHGDGAAGAGGIGSVPAPPIAPAPAPPGPMCMCDGGSGLPETLAGGAERSAGALGNGVDRLGATAGGEFSRLSPPLGRDARRGTGVIGERARRAGTATGEAVRGLPGGAPPAHAIAPARRVLR